METVRLQPTHFEQGLYRVFRQQHSKQWPRGMQGRIGRLLVVVSVLVAEPISMPVVFVALVATQGAAGGVMSVLQGGKFGHGFASAGFSKLASPFLPTTGIRFKGLDIGQVAAAAIIGGTASELSGGKFANGAVTAAFVNLLNQQRAGYVERGRSMKREDMIRFIG